MKTLIGLLVSLGTDLGLKAVWISLNARLFGVRDRLAFASAMPCGTVDEDLIIDAFLAAQMRTLGPGPDFYYCGGGAPMPAAGQGGNDRDQGETPVPKDWKEAQAPTKIDLGGGQGAVRSSGEFPRTAVVSAGEPMGAGEVGGLFLKTRNGYRFVSADCLRLASFEKDLKAVDEIDQSLVQGESDDTTGDARDKNSEERTGGIIYDLWNAGSGASKDVRGTEPDGGRQTSPPIAPLRPTSPRELRRPSPERLT
jgi:hypothetical protein